LKTTVEDARRELGQFMMTNSGLDIKGMSLNIDAIDGRRRRRAVDVTHLVTATIVHLVPAGSEVTGDDVALPFVQIEMESAEIDFTDFEVKINTQVEILTVLPEITTPAPEIINLDMNDFNAVVSAISNELPTFDLGAIFGASAPTSNRPVVSGAQASVNSETVEGVREIVATPVVNNLSGAVGNRPGRPSQNTAEEIRVPTAGNRPSSVDSDGRNGPNVFPTYTGKQGRSCFMCSSTSYAGCISGGSVMQCELGDLERCHIEVRKTNGKIVSVISGCKQAVACNKGIEQNFVVDSNLDTDASRHDQCKPNMPMASMRFGKIQSVCRQCFSTSDGLAANILAIGTGEEIKIPTWDGTTFWKLSVDSSADSAGRQFWLSNLYLVQQTNN